MAAESDTDEVKGRKGVTIENAAFCSFILASVSENMAMDAMSRDSEAPDYAASLEYTLKELQRKVQEHEAELERMRASADEETALAAKFQSTIIKSALDDVSSSEPFLPFPGSTLPALLALRKTHQTIVQSKAVLAAQGRELERARRRLHLDRASLSDQHLLETALGARVQSLRSQLRAASEIPLADAAVKRIGKLRARRDKYDAETARLMRSLLALIRSRLAMMLLVEELGGPVVGSAVDIAPEHLAAGSNAHGKPNRLLDDTKSRGRQQRRLDEFWGTANEADQGVTAAGREMQQLIEELLNTLVEAQGDISASYVQLSRESAAARFLVRSKVAQFHPKDATRIRLVDFGRELDS